jgi:protein-S-isoprenylcysteine O-methyltransferase Ste14
MFWRLMKTLLFTVVMPGTVGVYVPQGLKHDGVPLPEALRYLGVTLFACGAMFYFWCAWDFVAKGLGTPAPIDAPRVLVAKGLYRFTRNPMYVGVASVILGQALYYGSRSVAIYGGFVVLAFHLFVLFYEEPTLKRLFGAEYSQYCARVPRWVLRLRRG